MFLQIKFGSLPFPKNVKIAAGEFFSAITVSSTVGVEVWKKYGLGFPIRNWRVAEIIAFAI
jgi:hypothetical protein